MRFLLCLFLVLPLSNCATTPSVSFTPNNIATEASFLFIDERAGEQKVTYERTDANGKNLYFGDDKLTPTGPQLLKAALQQNLNLELIGKKVVLTDFLVIVNDPTISIDNERLHASANSAPNGAAAAPLAEALIGSIERGKKNVYIRITGKVGETDYSKQNSQNFWAGVSESNMKSIINKTIDDSVKEIRDIVSKK